MVLPRRLALVAVLVLAAALTLTVACGGGKKNKDRATGTPGTAVEATSVGNDSTPQPGATAGPSTSGSGNGGSVTQVPKTTPSPDQLAAVEDLAQEVLAAVQQRDIARLRALFTTRLLDAYDEQDIQRTFDCMTGATTADPPFTAVEVTTGANPTAGVRAVFQTVVGGETRLSERPWDFRLENGQWKLDRPLPCPPKQQSVEPTDSEAG